VSMPPRPAGTKQRLHVVTGNCTFVIALPSRHDAKGTNFTGSLVIDGPFQPR